MYGAIYVANVNLNSCKLNLIDICECCIFVGPPSAIGFPWVAEPGRLPVEGIEIERVSFEALASRITGHRPHSHPHGRRGSQHGGMGLHLH